MEEEIIKKEEQQPSSEKKNYTTIVLVITVILLLGVIGYLLFFRNPEKESPPTPTSSPTIEPTPVETSLIEPTIEPTPAATPTIKPTIVPTATPKPAAKTSTFKYVDDNYGLASLGYAFVKGYAVVNDDNVVDFYIQSTDSNDFKKALEEWGYESNKIHLGCLKNNVISYTTGADEFGPSNYTGAEEDAYLYYMKDISLSSDITNKIISSNSNNPITLKLSKSKLTHYINLYEECRTEITNIDLVD